MWRPVCFILLAGTCIVQQYRECLLCFHGKVSISITLLTVICMWTLQGKHCCTSMATVVMQILQSVTLYYIAYLFWVPYLPLCKTCFFFLRYFEGLWSKDTVRSKSLGQIFLKNQRHVGKTHTFLFIQNKLHWHIYRLLCLCTVSEELLKIPLFGPSLIHELQLLGTQQHPWSGVLLTSFSTWTEISLAEINLESTGEG